MRLTLIIPGILVTLLLTSVSGAEDRRLSPIGLTAAAADEACASYAGTLLAHAEKDDPDQVAVWKLKCEHHPTQSTCESTVKFLAQNSYLHVLNCVDGLHTAEPRGPAQIDPKIATADDACGSIAGTYEAHAENDDRRQVAQWRVVCAHHPLRDRCESTVKFIEERRHLHVFDCVAPVR